MKEGQKLWTREEFMAFFRNDESLQTLTADDRIEIFSQILTGSSDFTEELIGSVLADYCVSGIRVVEEH
jgi:hypothetical protein